MAKDQNIETLDGIPAGDVLKSETNGISLIGLRSPAGMKFDVPITPPGKALKIIADALDLIIRKSPFTARQIKRLTTAGPVVIVYDPHYPNRLASMASIQVALFAPHFYDNGQRSRKKKFLIVVSRHGVKWPEKELAAVLVHELVGHGIQHLNARWGDMRRIDMECEAWLYEEMAYQRLGMNKFSREMIDFKKQLAKQCDGFTRHLRNKDKAGLALWETLNPDVPKLLRHFSGYLKQLPS
ncbi:MAG: hypothetical protein ACTSV1_06345 [Alphaproteobacteria bacterium]